MRAMSNNAMPDGYAAQYLTAIMQQQEPPPLKLGFADLFAGLGGWAHGALSVGEQFPQFEQVFAIESDPQTGVYYRNNLRRLYDDDPNTRRQNPIVVPLPIERVRSFEFPGTDVLFATPPPRSWSSDAALHRAVQPQPLARYISEFVSHTRPMFLFVEAPYVAPDERRYHQLVEDLDGLGYTISISLVDMAAFGVPETRRRSILIAARKPLIAPMIQPYSPMTIRGWHEWLGGYRHMRLSRLRDWQVAALPDHKPRALYETLKALTGPRGIPLPMYKTWLDSEFTDANGKQLPIALAGRANTTSISSRAGNLPYFSIAADIGWQPWLVVTPDSDVRRMSIMDAATIHTFNTDRLVLPKKEMFAGRLVAEAMPPMFARILVELTLSANNFVHRQDQAHGDTHETIQPRYADSSSAHS